MSDDLRRQRHDLHELLVAQLAPHGPEDAGRPRFALVRDEHGGVFVEADVGAVLALGLLGGPDDHRPDDLPLLDLARGDGVLDRDDDDVSQPRVATLGPAEDADHECPPGARVVRVLEHRFLLHHGPPPRLTSRARRCRPPASAWTWTGAASPRSGPCRRPWPRARRGRRPSSTEPAACRTGRARIAVSARR